jgi:hypothetical protein
MGEPITFPLSTAPGINPTESGGRLINAYAAAESDGSRSRIVQRRVPGLRPAFTAGSSTFRGAVLVDNTLYVSNGDKIYSVTKAAGVYTVMQLTGTMPGTGPCFMARNMNATPQILIVHSNGMSQIAAGAVADFTDPDLPAPNSISFMDSYFLPTIESGYVFASGVNDITFSAVDKSRAEGAPDGLLRSVPSGSSLLLMGTTSIEFWSDTANATGFPFTRSSVLRVGLWGRYAVAGYEEGFTEGVMFVANDNSVRMVSGYDAVPISNPDLEALIAAIDDHDTIEASVYVDRGRPVFVISSPSWTWEYCTTTKQWNERKSLGQNRWRAHGGILAFDEWLTFDTSTNDVYRIDATFARENADQLVFEVRSTQAHRFPARAEIKRSSFDMMTGVGIAAGIDPIETTPKVQISWSDDGGITFGNPIFRDLGRQGEIRGIDVRNCGLTKRLGRQWKIVVADPVDVALYGGAVDIEARAA